MQVVTLLLGSQGLTTYAIIHVIYMQLVKYTGTEKLTATVKHAAPENIFAQHVSMLNWLVNYVCTWITIFCTE